MNLGKLVASPTAGLIVWLIVWLIVFYCSLLFSEKITIWVLLIGTGSIVHLGMGISKLTGDAFLERKKQTNTFKKLFFYRTAQALLVYAIPIPFFLKDYTSLYLFVGILTGLM